MQLWRSSDWRLNQFPAFMLKPIFTLDYEIHGNGDGCPRELMVEPTRRMLNQFDRYGAKLTIMADVAEILKFKEHKEQTGRDDFHYEAIAEQLRDALRRGHDVQLHLHAGYFNATHNGKGWQQDWAEYDFAGLPFSRMDELVRVGKSYLEELLQPVSQSYRCIAFRAANWSVSPSRNVVQVLIKNGITIETSVFKYGRRNGLVKFDYTNAHSDMIPWRVDEADICLKNNKGILTEVPIYCERRWIGAFLTPSRIYRAKLTRAHSVADDYRDVGGAAPARKSLAKNLYDKFALLSRRQAWKADFNQCTGHQLIAALERAERKYAGLSGELPFVLIGHSKQFTLANERSIEPFLKFIQTATRRFRFANLNEACHGQKN